MLQWCMGTPDVVATIQQLEGIIKKHFLLHGCYANNIQ